MNCSLIPGHRYLLELAEDDMSTGTQCTRHSPLKGGLVRGVRCCVAARRRPLATSTRRPPPSIRCACGDWSVPLLLLNVALRWAFGPVAVCVLCVGWLCAWVSCAACLLSFHRGLLLLWRCAQEGCEGKQLGCGQVWSRFFCSPHSLSYVPQFCGECGTPSSKWARWVLGRPLAVLAVLSLCLVPDFTAPLHTV